MVLLHGWMDVSASFQFLVDALRARLGRLRAGLARLRADRLGQGPTATGFPTTSPTWTRCWSRSSPRRRSISSATAWAATSAALYAGVRPARVARFVNLEGFGMPRDARRAGAEALCALDGRAARAAAAAALRELRRARRPAAAGNNPRLTRERAEFLARHWGQGGQGRAASSCAATPRTSSSTRRSTATRRRAPAGSRSTAPVLWVDAARSETHEAHGARRRASMPNGARRSGTCATRR